MADSSSDESCVWMAGPSKSKTTAGKTIADKPHKALGEKVAAGDVGGKNAKGNAEAAVQSGVEMTAHSTASVVDTNIDAATNLKRVKKSLCLKDMNKSEAVECESLVAAPEKHGKTLYKTAALGKSPTKASTDTDRPERVAESEVDENTPNLRGGYGGYDTDATTSGAEAADDEKATGGETTDEGILGLQTVEDAFVKDKSEGTQAKASTAALWSASEDACLLAMKEGGETWATIARLMRRGKKEVAKRYKELASKATSTSTSAPVLVETSSTTAHKLTTVQPVGAGTQKPTTGKSTGATIQAAVEKTVKFAGTPEKTAAKSAVAKTTISAAMPQKAKGKGPVTKTPNKKNAATATMPTNASKGVEMSKKAEKGPAAGAAGTDSGSEEEKSSNGSTSDSSSSSGYSADFDPNDGIHSLAELFMARYPTSEQFSRVEPDDHFSRRDIRLLGALDTQYRAERWLQLQAKFCNVTGRNIPAFVLKRKFGDETDEALTTV